MLILHVSSEAAPLAGTGGLGDVLGALPKAQAALGHEVHVVLPLYRSARARANPLLSSGQVLRVPIADRVVDAPLWRTFLPGSPVPVHLVEHDGYYHREDLYGTGDGEFKDNAERFVFLSRAALEVARVLGRKPDILHAHDWQAGLAPVYLDQLYRKDPAWAGARCVFTIHNLAYQGLFWHWDLKLTGLEWALFNWKQLEFYGKLNFLKAGIVFADAVTTVSPRYAREIQTAEFGCGLDGVLRGRADRLHGIVNGVDVSAWDPARDPWLPATYSAQDPSGKAKCKSALQKKCGLAEAPAVPLLAMVTRLADQKGPDLALEVLPDVLRDDAQFVLLGSGAEKYERGFADLAKRHRGRAFVRFDYDPKFAHEIEAGADLFLMPSRYEPCGLNQMYSLRYGTVPVVRETGGLADTVVDATPENLAQGTATGFVFGPYEARAFAYAIRRALRAHREPETWRRIIRAGMAHDFSWANSARAYLELYAKLKGNVE